MLQYCMKLSVEEKRKRQAGYQAKWYEANREQHVAAVARSRAKRLDKIREYVWEYLLEHPCVDCGEADPIVLEFDHVRGEKSFTIGVAMASRPVADVISEIEKCDVRCCNCHRRKTSSERNWWRQQESNLPEKCL